MKDKPSVVFNCKRCNNEPTLYKDQYDDSGMTIYQHLLYCKACGFKWGGKLKTTLFDAYVAWNNDNWNG